MARNINRKLLLPDGVKASLTGDNLTIAGKKGELNIKVHNLVKVSIEEESLLDTYVIWGMKFDWGSIIDFYKDPDYSKLIKSITDKHGGYWGIFKIYMSLIPLKFKIFKLCMKMTKRWNYHHISYEYLNKSLREIREEYNIQLLSLDQIPIGRYQASQMK